MATPPRLELDAAADRLVRHEGLLRKQALPLADVVEVVGLSRDALTHEEVLVAFRTASGSEWVASEFDAGFADIVAALSERFPGLADWASLAAGAIFEPRRRVLWEATRGD